MIEVLHSPLWYRVAHLKPRLRDHVRIHRHHYRGQRWYLLQDQASGNMHRFSQAAYFLIGLMDGDTSLDSLWETTLDRLGDAAPTQDETIQMLGQLHAADALQCDLSPDSAEVFRRYRRHTQARWKQRLLAPLAVRIPLLDPERFLTRWLPRVRPLFTRTAFVAWGIIVLTALVLAGMHWSEITGDIVDRVLSPRNLLVLWFTYPVVKVLHELGHAFATRLRGGEVHEMGIMLLALVPVPYVDASAATGFEDKHQRMLVGAAGMIVELLLAAIALFVWLSIEPGIVSSVAYNIMLIGSVSTLFFNGNPLLRFDGYYILADAVEIPNLGSRSNRYLGYLFQRYLLGMKDAPSPVQVRGEAAWFACYGLAAFVYRIMILFIILFYVASKYFAIGVLLALWAATTQLLLPLLHKLYQLFSGPLFRNQRLRAAGTTALLGGMLVWGLFFMPVPSWTRTEGVVWLPEQSRIRAGTDCFITGVLAETGTPVRRGDVVLRCADPLLEAERHVAAARLRELKSHYAATRPNNLVDAEGVREKITNAAAELELLTARLDALALRSPANGKLVIPHRDDLAGRFIHQGDVVAYVMDGATPDARVVVTQDRIGLVREQTQDVSVRLAGYPGRQITATIGREVPAATRQLPSRTLGTAGGGHIPVDPDDDEGLKTLDTVFQFDLVLQQSPPADYFGQRVHVRFDHGSEPLASQWQRSLHQLFMRRFGV